MMKDNLFIVPIRYSCERTTAEKHPHPGLNLNCHLSVRPVTAMEVSWLSGTGIKILIQLLTFMQLFWPEEEPQVRHTDTCADNNKDQILIYSSEFVQTIGREFVALSSACYSNPWFQWHKHDISLKPHSHRDDVDWFVISDWFMATL